MDMENEVPTRKRNRLENYDYSTCGAYFITICAKDRRNCFWEDVGVVNQLKGCVSKQIEMAILQKTFHDHIIRNHIDYEEHLRYIHENPMRWHYDELYTE